MLKKVFVLLFVLTSASVSVAGEGDLCPCVPTPQHWTVTSCETWTCAQLAMVAANGDPYVMSMPTASPAHKWIILRRVVGGSSSIVPDGPFMIDSFESIAQASALYASFSPEMVPILTSTVDGKLLVIRLRTPERRRVAGR